MIVDCSDKIKNKDHLGIFNHKIHKINLARWLSIFCPKYNRLEFANCYHALICLLLICFYGVSEFKLKWHVTE